MSASVRADVVGTSDRDRARYVWLVLALSTLAFFGLCALVGNSIFGFLTSVTERSAARLELRKGAQLTLQRFGSSASEVVADEAALEEGDRTTTGPGSEGYIDLFGGDITVYTYFSTTVTIDRLRTSRFFQNLREMRLTLNSGIVVVATGPPSDYTDEDYVVATEDGDVVIPSQSRIRVYKDTRGEGTTVVVEEGTAAVFSKGNRIDIDEGRMVSVDGEGTFSAVSSAFEDLVSNDRFIDPWTREADRVEHGGLDIAAWTTIREAASATDTRSNSIVVITEVVGSSVNYLVDIKRQGPNDQYGRLGIRQEINRPVDYLHTIELAAVIRVVQQPSIIGGPAGNVYPLTIRVNYTDAQGRAQQWVRSFYYGQDSDVESDPPEVKQVEQNRWTTVTYTLKPNADQPGFEPDIINSIEIYGYGPQFNSSINSISLTGR
ncbi:MAG TPA: hypothetical protein VFH60_03190 [Chloroflexia bacterium]|nr:hypothetical protein [Chloroflexia bacterium]